MDLVRTTQMALKEILEAIRAELGDRAKDYQGNEIPAAALRYSDKEIFDALNWQLISMQTEMSGRHAGEALLSVALAYPSMSDAVSLAGVSPGLVAEAIYDVIEKVAADYAVVLDYVSPREIHRQIPSAGSLFSRSKRYTLLGGDEFAGRLAVVPVPAAPLSLEIRYVAEPFVFRPGAQGAGDDFDRHPLSTRWRELVILGAAAKILNRDNHRMTDARLEDLDQLWAQFHSFSTRRRGLMRVTRKRRARS